MLIPSWPEACAPTAEQWLDWLLANDREHQLIIAERVCAWAEGANQCRFGDHEEALTATREAIVLLHEDAARIEQLYTGSTRLLLAKLRGYRRLLNQIKTARSPRRLP